MRRDAVGLNIGTVISHPYDVLPGKGGGVWGCVCIGDWCK